jgi:hypothetical protein
MKITIDYNGSFAICNVTDFHNPLRWVNFNEADRMTQAYALSAFDCIREHFQRETKKK